MGWKKAESFSDQHETKEEAIMENHIEIIVIGIASFVPVIWAALILYQIWKKVRYTCLSFLLKALIVVACVKECQINDKAVPFYVMIYMFFMFCDAVIMSGRREDEGRVQRPPTTKTA